MTDAKPSVTKAFNEAVFPALKADGFVAATSKIYLRCTDGEIIQAILLGVKSGLRREYLLEYTSMLLCEPHTFWNLSLGGRFSKGTSGGTYGAQHEHMLALSLPRALAAYHEEIRPKLEAASSLSSFTQSFEQMVQATKRPTGHEYCTLAVAYSRGGRDERAREMCGIAERLYRETIEQNPFADWAPAAVAKVEKLVNAISAGTSRVLLNEWRRETISALGLQKHIDIIDRNTKL